jgi:hypothetical protein
MLDALKFAFEILIVGALALPWLAILNQMFEAVGPSSTRPAFLSFIPEDAHTTVTLVLVIAFGYVAGSVVSRASRNLFNDELLWPVPTEDLIRVAVYQEEYCHKEQMNVNENTPKVGEETGTSDTLFEDSSAPAPDPSRPINHLHKKYRDAFCPPTRTKQSAPESSVSAEKIALKLEEHITSMFRLQEGEMLLLGDDKVARLKQYNDQITVLRGAAFNGFVLLTVCIIGCCANLRVRAGERRTKIALAYLPAAALFSFGIYWLVGHYLKIHTAASDLHHVPSDQIMLSQTVVALYNDPPLAESAVILLGAVGLLVIFKAKKTAPYLRTTVVAGIVFVVCFGAWWWTEIMYDLQVIHSQVELRPNSADSVGNAKQPSN